MACDKILIIDDEAEVRSLVSDVLTDEGYKTEVAADEHEAVSILKTYQPNLIFLDLWIGSDESAGIKILNKIKKLYPDIPVVIISGHGTIDVAVQAIQNGAFDFIEKPFVIDRLLLTCKRALELCQLRTENSALKYDRLDASVFSIGKSKFAQSIRTTIEKIAPSNSRVFILTHTGMGTDALAFEIHKKSKRSNHNFVHINCAADNKEKLKEEIFGTEKIYGGVEKANGGTLFLENVNELSNDCQRLLLQFLQDERYHVGNRTVYSDVRIISSCNKSINELQADPKFSQELFYRLNIVNLDIPSISSRREDILPLVNYYLDNSESFFGIKTKKFTEDALAILQSYNWPGNIHQIKNIVENSLINSAESNVIDKDSLPSELISGTTDKMASLDIANFIVLPLKDAKDRFETDYLLAQIERFSGNISRTANFVGMERSALHRKLKNLGVHFDRKSDKGGK
ncbi:MAG: sigma-54 dependent transcriptional regulator [Alphaproteobacteria bacterium]|nr:sigma-54 dependent transcriptional regulator [Alphaproteobacteria bacterium]